MADLSPLPGNPNGALTNGGLQLRTTPVSTATQISFGLQWSTTLAGRDSANDRLVLGILNLTTGEWVIIEDVAERSAGSINTNLSRPTNSQNVVYLAWFHNGDGSALSPNQVLAGFKTGTVSDW